METSEFKRPIRKMWKRGVANLKRKIFDEMTSEEHEFVIQCLLHTEGAIVVSISLNSSCTGALAQYLGAPAYSYAYEANTALVIEA